jgi:hypothetical protein
MKTTMKTNARWLFGSDGRTNDARLERSEAANEDILTFYFQMDLETRIQVSSIQYSIVNWKLPLQMEIQF